MALRLLILTFGLSALLGIATIHYRTQIILVGYEIGTLKTQEIQLLQQRNFLTAQVEKLKTKPHLTQKLIDASGR